MEIDIISIESTHHQYEDSVSVKDISDNCLVAVVADGIGGMTFGKEAADTVTESVTDYVFSHTDGNTPHILLSKALTEADQKIADTCRELHSPMGAAIAIAYIQNKTLHYSWLGNVRIYLLHDDNIELLTKDHVLNVGYGRTSLTRCIKGYGLRDDNPFMTRELLKGDSILICTDGLYNQASDLELMKLQSSNAEYIIENRYDDATCVRISL